MGASKKNTNLPTKKKTDSKFPKAVKCCKHCQDYKVCDERKVCCEFCDHYMNGRCAYNLTKKLNKEGIEIWDYRGDDFGIDDYSAYEEISE